MLTRYQMCKNFLLIQSPPANIECKKARHELSPPLGILYLSSYLRQFGFGVSIDPWVKPKSKREFFSLLDAEQPSIVGISSVTMTYPNALKIAKSVKEWNPNCIVVLGGPHVTFCDEDALSNEFVDFVVRREGEVTMLELALNILSGYPLLEEIKGLSYKSEGKVIRNPDRPFITNLDALPFPDRSLIDLSRIIEDNLMITTITSRGCPGRCIFCLGKTMSGGHYRMRSAEHVFTEMIQMYYTLHAKTIGFVDDTITVDPKRIERICRYIINSGIELVWGCESRVDSIARNEDIIKLMAKAGCRAIQFGVESGVQEILDEIKKGIIIEQILDAVKFASRYGINAGASFIIGHPSDTMETIKQTAQFAYELREIHKVKLNWAILTPFPGTYVYEHRDELGIKINTFDWSMYTIADPIISTKNLSARELVEAYYRVEEHEI